jgi:hypothetical protein
MKVTVLVMLTSHVDFTGPRHVQKVLDLAKVPHIGESVSVEEYLVKVTDIVHSDRKEVQVRVAAQGPAMMTDIHKEGWSRV